MATVLDYFTRVEALVEQTTGSDVFIRDIAYVVKPKAVPINPNGLYLISSKADLLDYTDNISAEQFFDSGKSYIYLIVADDLSLSSTLDAVANQEKFYTIIVSEDFSSAEVELAEFGAFDGVVAYAQNDFNQAIVFNNSYVSAAEDTARGLIHAFSRLTSGFGTSWSNQQAISGDSISSNPVSLEGGIGLADNYFNNRLTFYVSDQPNGVYLGGFFYKNNPIVAPYILKQFNYRLQQEAFKYIQLNQPNNTAAEKLALKDYLTVNLRGVFSENEIATINITIELITVERFKATGKIGVVTPDPLWIQQYTIRQTFIN